MSATELTVGAYVYVPEEGQTGQILQFFSDGDMVVSFHDGDQRILSPEEVEP
jgi:hypothetical protein